MAQRFKLYPRSLAIRMGETNPKKIARKLKSQKKKFRKQKGAASDQCNGEPPTAA